MQNNQTIRELTMQNTPVGHAGFVNSSCCSVYNEQENSYSCVGCTAINYILTNKDQLASMLAEKLAS